MTFEWYRRRGNEGLVIKEFPFEGTLCTSASPGEGIKVPTPFNMILRESEEHRIVVRILNGEMIFELGVTSLGKWDARAKITSIDLTPEEEKELKDALKAAAQHQQEVAEKALKNKEIIQQLLEPEEEQKSNGTAAIEPVTTSFNVEQETTL